MPFFGSLVLMLLQSEILRKRMSLPLPNNTFSTPAQTRSASFCIWWLAIWFACGLRQTVAYFSSPYFERPMSCRRLPMSLDNRDFRANSSLLSSNPFFCWSASFFRKAMYSFRQLWYSKSWSSRWRRCLARLTMTLCPRFMRANRLSNSSVLCSVLMMGIVTAYMHLTSNIPNSCYV